MTHNLSTPNWLASRLVLTLGLAVLLLTSCMPLAANSQPA